ncbi:hypothetical protein Q5762_08335 [Streptomyces sp. P9(2023)]|uniref:hypothetical protein n=1 Tax=Streptomyces sp. P9(2023) TaxID=3064394 RepID=UPI0028F44F7B|nr:hypothetical protein [Streptomyces sp. P9(2023)]MDT9688363.1 hypothetical protein [Streptomyces sp. P9(2023)]
MTVTRPARLTGAALCGALALVIVGWLLKDLAAFGSPAELAWYWAGDHVFLLRRRSATSLLDPLLLVVYAATAVAALRSSLAAPALAAAGAVTLALRLPGLWATGVDALVTTLLTLALAAGLVVTAAVGRHAVADSPPARPRRGPAVAAGVLCAVAGLAWAAWEVHWARALPVEATVDRFTGGRALLLPVLAAPPAWLNVMLAALFLAAAGTAFARAPYARPLGLLAGLFLTGWGLAALATALRLGWAEHLAALDDDGRLALATSVYGLLAGAAVLVLLSVRGAPHPVPRRPVAALPPAPPQPRPPGW